MILNSVADIAKIVTAVIVGLLITVGVLLAVSNQPTHNEMYARQEMIEAQLRYISCLLLIPEDPPSPEAVAACQIEPEQ